MMLVDENVVTQSHKSQRQFNECMVLQGKNLRTTCQNLPEMLTDIGIFGIYLLHDNASSHKAGSVTSFLVATGVRVCSRTFTLFR